MSAEIISAKLGATLAVLAGAEAAVSQSFSPLIDKAPYVAAVVAVVWIFSKLIERLIADFRETIKAGQDVQQDAIETNKELLSAVKDLESLVNAEKDAIERLEQTVKERA